jgi:AAA domain-containing protein
MLAERFGNNLPLFRMICLNHDHFSENDFLSELLRASHHKLSNGRDRQKKLERLVSLFAVRARNAGGNHVVLIVDEAQRMHDAEYKTLLNLQNLLDDLGYRLTVISVGSHELAYQHAAFVRGGDIQIMGRFMVEDAEFRGICSCDELAFVLRGYDHDSKWPQPDGCSYTQFFFPRAFEAGFRFEDYGPVLWEVFENLAPPGAKRQLELAMQHIAKTVEGVCRKFSDDEITSFELTRDILEEEVKRTGYQKYMRAVRLLPRRQKEESLYRS